jgi:hypothetical protein
VGFFSILLVVIFAVLYGCNKMFDAPTGRLIEPGTHAQTTSRAFCMDSRESSSKLQDWALRRDYEEMNRLFATNGITMLGNGDSVKVLETSGGQIKVRTSLDMECWLPPGILE